MSKRERNLGGRATGGGGTKRRNDKMPNEKGKRAATHPDSNRLSKRKRNVVGGKRGRKHK